MLESAAAVGTSLRSMLLYVLISRQAQGHEDFLRVTTAVSSKPFTYKRFVHFPVSFFNEADCPFCLRQRLATMLSVSAGPGAAAAAAMQALADAQRPAFMYGRPPSSVKPQELAGRFSVPVSTGADFSLEKFDTLSGAKACLAVSVATQRDMDIRTARALLDHCRTNVALWSYGLYCLASRYVTRGALWQDEGFRTQLLDVCKKMGNELQHRQALDASDPLADAAIDLTVAAWFAPDDALQWALAGLVAEADGLLSHEPLRNELFLLSFRLATLKPKSGGRETPPLDRLRSAVVTAQRRLSQTRGPQRVLSLDAIERLIRLRQVLQIAGGELLKEPWLEGLVYLLSRLSYQGGHEFIGYVNRRDLAHAVRLRDAVSGLLSQPTLSGGQHRLNDPDQVLSELSAFLRSSRNDLTYLANALGPVLSNWFRALELAGELPHGFQSVESLIVQAQSEAKKLLASISELASAARERDHALAMRALEDVVTSQKRVYGAVYELREQDLSHTLRSHIEAQLCPLYDLAPRLSRERLAQEDIL
jgi:hypothetical protein